jgi:hypothetical protein
MNAMRSLRAVGLLALALAAAGGARADGQLALVFPAVKQMGPPDWLKPGVRPRPDHR